MMQEDFPPFFTQFQQTCENLALGLVSARVRVRALIEVLEEKGVFGTGQYDEHAGVVWDRDYDELAREMLPPTTEPEVPPAPEAPPGLKYERRYAEALAGFVDEAIAARVRIRAVIEVLEQQGVLGPGEFDQKAEAIWERDYEELALEFYGGRY